MRSSRTAAISRACGASPRALQRRAPIGERHRASHADFFLAPHFGGFREEMDHVLLLDMAIHGFDALRCMTGLDGRRRLLPRMEPAALLVSSRLVGGGVSSSRTARVFTYRGSWCAPGPAHVLGMRVALRRRRKGTLTWDGDGAIRIEVVDRARATGLFDAVAPVEPPPLDAATTASAAMPACSPISSPPFAIRRAARDRRRRQHPSLAMVLGAIASAEAGAPRRHRDLSDVR